MRQCRIIRLPAAALLLALASCDDAPDRNVAVAAIAEGKPEIERLPLRPADTVLRGALAQGLIALDSEGRVEPALARRWIVTDDGLSYIFRIEGAAWADGSEARADQLAALLKARIAELARKGWRRDLHGIDTVEAMTGNVIEIRLSTPQPHLLQLLAAPELGLVRRGSGTGPLALAPTGGTLRLVAADALRPRQDDGSADDGERPGRGSLTFAPTSAAAGLVDHAEGRIDLLLGGRFEHLPLLAASGVDGNAVRTDPVAGLFGLLVVRPAGPLAEPELREALAMAIDRPRLLSSFNLGRWQEALTLVPEGLPDRGGAGRPAWTYAAFDQRQATARERVAAWRAANGPVPELRVALPEGPGARILFARLAGDWRRIGVPARRVAATADADLRLIDRVSDYDSPLWYLARLACGEAPVCSEDADQQIDAGMAEADLARRAALFGEAEVTLARFQNFIPIASPVRWWLIRPEIAGVAANPRGVHRLQPLLAGPTSR